MVFGEITTKAQLNYSAIVREAVKQIGFDDSSKGFDYKTCNVLVAIEQQSPDIAQAVHVGRAPEEVTAGDQGLMFGYATDETPELHPLSHLLATQLAKRLSECRREGILPWVRPDGKTQVTVEYEEIDGATIPKRVHTVLISTQHAEEVSNEEIREKLRTEVIDKVIDAKYLDANTVYHLNPSGRFVIGGPQGDAGLTGRKIIVDSYGGRETLFHKEFVVAQSFFLLARLGCSRRWRLLWQGPEQGRQICCLRCSLGGQVPCGCWPLPPCSGASGLLHRSRCPAFRQCELLRHWQEVR